MCGSSGGGQALTQSRDLNTGLSSADSGPIKASDWPIASSHGPCLLPPSQIRDYPDPKSVSQESLSCETIFDGNVQGSRGVMTAKHRWRLNEVVTLIVGCEC